MGNSDTKELRPKDMADLQKCTQFGGSEISKFYQNFNHEYKNGYMNKQDFFALYKRMFPKGDAKQFSEYMFKNHDVDKNGQVNFREFLCILSLGKHGTIEQKLEWSFGLYDLNEDGFITNEEALLVITALLKLRSELKYTPQQIVSEMFRTLDKNKDGLLSKEEFVNGAKASPSFANFLKVV